MKTYQLNVELQVHSTDEDASSVRDKWNRAISDWFKYDGLPATLSAIKCAEVHTFDEAHFDKQSASPAAKLAIDEIALLMEINHPDGEARVPYWAKYDAPADTLVMSRWPNVSDWECGPITYSEGVVTLHDLYVVERPA